MDIDLCFWYNRVVDELANGVELSDNCFPKGDSAWSDVHRIVSESDWDGLFNEVVTDNYLRWASDRTDRHKIDLAFLALEAGANPVTIDDKSVVANLRLLWNCRQGKIPEVEDAITNPDMNLTGALLIASEYNQPRIVTILLGCPRINPNELWTQNALIFACGAGHLGVVRILLEDGRIDPTDYDHWAIFQAIDADNPDILRLLLADPSVKGSHLADCLHQAIRMRRVECTAILLDSGCFDGRLADINLLHSTAAISDVDDGLRMLAMLLKHPLVRKEISSEVLQYFEAKLGG